MFTLHHTRNPQLPLRCLNSNTSSDYQLGSKQLCWAKVRWLSHQKSGVSWEDGMSPLRHLGWHGLSLSATEADKFFPKNVWSNNNHGCHDLWKHHDCRPVRNIGKVRAKVCIYLDFFTWPRDGNIKRTPMMLALIQYALAFFCLDMNL